MRVFWRIKEPHFTGVPILEYHKPIKLDYEIQPGRKLLYLVLFIQF